MRVHELQHSGSGIEKVSMNNVCVCVCVCSASDSFPKRMCSIKTHRVQSSHPIGQDGLLFMELSKIDNVISKACMSLTHTHSRFLLYSLLLFQILFYLIYFDN